MVVNCTLSFTAETKSNGIYIIKKSTTFKSNILDDSKINIQQIDTRISRGDPTEPAFTDITTSNFGIFHLYHPIFLQGYKADLDLVIPEQPSVPAFLFHYYQDYEYLKEIDAGINLFINITVDFGLFFITGGVSTLTNLRHIKYLSQIGKALRNALKPSELVTFWAAANSSTQALTLTASTVYALSQYTSLVTNDLERKNMAVKLSDWMLASMLISIGPAIVAERRAITTAKAFVNEVELLNNAGKPLVPAGTTVKQIAALNDAIIVATKVGGDEVFIINKIISKLTALGTDGNDIKTLFNSPAFTLELKLSFYTEFYNLSDVNKWKKLNTNNAKAIENWKDLKAINAADRTQITLLLSQKRVDGIKKYYTIEALKDKLEALPFKTRMAFIDNFDYTNITIFNKFVTNPELITYWKRYFDDKILWDVFSTISESNQIRWLEEYGELTSFLRNELKTKPLTFKNWENLDEADKLFLRNIPNEWIPSVYQFDDFCFIRKFCPVQLPSNVGITEKIMTNNYKQVFFKWVDDNYKWEVRVHTEIPNSPGVGNGNVWIVNRKIPGSGGIAPTSEILLNNQTWYIYEPNFKILMNKQRLGTATPLEQQILKDAHFKAK